MAGSSAPGGEFDFFPVEGPHMGWINERFPETIPGHIRQLIGMDAPNKRFDTVVMGRGTYGPALAIGVTDPYPHLRTVVFSRSLPASSGVNVEVTAVDPVGRVRELKREDGLGLWLCGGADLAGRLRDEIDELIIKRYPIISGEGKPLVGGDFRPQPFTLVERHAFDNGVAVETLRRP